MAGADSQAELQAQADLQYSFSMKEKMSGQKDESMDRTGNFNELMNQIIGQYQESRQ